MGLAGPRKRTKLAHDPNNTKWTGNTESFGAKLMAAQGWQPGDFLGAKDARQAEHYTAGSASHIRVMIKDDNLGLGAKIGSGVGHGECTGLDAFKDLLGRLNGQDEDELEKEKKSREDLKRAIYSERKWGSTRFVRGGFLIGDKIQPLIEAEAERVRNLAKGPLDTAGTSASDSSSSSESDEETPPVEKPNKTKKRKLEYQELVSEVVAVKVKKSKRHRKSEAKSEDVRTTKDLVQDMKKSKKNRHSGVDGDATEEERRRRKMEKKAKKARKEEEKLRSREKEDAAKIYEKSKRKSGRSNMAESSESPIRNLAKEGTSASVPSSGYSSPMMQGRHAVRSRNIAQKRLASMDVASLNQIFMIKS